MGQLQVAVQYRESIFSDKTGHKAIKFLYVAERPSVPNGRGGEFSWDRAVMLIKFDRQQEQNMIYIEPICAF